MRVNQRVIVIPGRDQVMKTGNLLRNALKGSIAIKKVELVSQGVKYFMSHACKCACECTGVVPGVKHSCMYSIIFSIFAAGGRRRRREPTPTNSQQTTVAQVFAAYTEMVITEAERKLNLLPIVVRFKVQCRGHEGTTCLKNYKMQMTKVKHFLGLYSVWNGLHHSKNC